jgi:hypothetical protein
MLNFFLINQDENRNRRNNFPKQWMYSLSTYKTAVELISNDSTEDFIFDFNKA